MKQLTNYIQEKLHISKYKKDDRTSVPEVTGDYVVDKTLYGFMLNSRDFDNDEAYENCIELLKALYKKHKVKDLEFYASDNTLELHEDIMDDKIKELYHKIDNTNKNEINSKSDRTGVLCSINTKHDTSYVHLEFNKDLVFYYNVDYGILYAIFIKEEN